MEMPERPSAAEAARLLRQRIEMGGDELFLDGMSRQEALRLAEAAADGRTVRPPVHGSKPDAAPAPPAPSKEPDRPASSMSKSKPSGTTPDPDHLPLLVLPDTYDDVRSIALECTRCGLCRTRTRVVFSDGPPDAQLMVVGEAPGANEDETGVPFVGQAGRYLDLLLSTVGLSRDDSVYIANVLKCRPPGNRNPSPAEIEACSPYLKKQIELVRPRALLAVGSFSGKLLTGDQKSSLGKLRGRVHSYEGVPLVVTYHPAALLRNPNWTRPCWTDLQLLRDVIDAGSGA
jgi:DNA polymerase